MKAVQMIVACLGRMAIGTLFFLIGVQHILDWHGSTQDFCNGLNRLLDQGRSTPRLVAVVETALPWVFPLMVIGTIFLLLGGFLVFFGCKTRFGAFLLFLVTISTMLTLHAFWMYPMPERDAQMYYFMNNLAIVGGILTLMAFGNGAAKPKSPSKSPKEAQ